MKIEKLVFGGQGLAREAQTNHKGETVNRTIFVWNALPGEEVEVEYLEKKKDTAEAVATKILTPSPDRIEPIEPHFLSSSPWQMIAPAAETQLKQAVALETYGRNGGMILQNDPPKIISDEAHYFGYRNKIEFSFTEHEGKMSLAFFWPRFKK